MSISTEEKDRYLRETAIVLAREGFQTGKTDTSILAKVGIEGVNSNLATAIRTVVVVVMAWGMVFLTNSQNGIAEISKRSWLFIILSGLATGASWLCYYRALDCLFAVVQSDVNANKWLNDELKASQAARTWTADKVVDQSIPLGDYRKNIRHGLNKYSHCSPNQTSWNIYRKSDEKGMCRLELNYQHAVISKNGYYVDRYLCIHLYELMDSLPLYYSEYFADTVR